MLGNVSFYESCSLCEHCVENPDFKPLHDESGNDCSPEWEHFRCDWNDPDCPHKGAPCIEREKESAKRDEELVQEEAEEAGY